MTDLVTIAVDTGASGIKVVGGIGDQPCVATLIAPHCMKIDDPNLMEKNDNFDKNCLWVKIDGEAYAVGTLAETQGASLRMKPAKFTTATPKICAAIGAVMQRLKLPAKFDLNLVCVLPPSEFDDRKIVIEKVSSAIKTLEFPSGKTKIKLKNIKIYPEGYGLLQGQKDKPKDVDSMTMVMMGYRNISTFETKRGMPCKPHTSNYGFDYFLADVASQTGYKKEDLLEPILTEEISIISRFIQGNIQSNIDIQKLAKEDLEKLEKSSSSYNYYDDEKSIKKKNEIKELKVKIKDLDEKIKKDEKFNLEMDKKHRERYYKIIKSEGNDRDYENTKILQAVEKAKQSYVTKITEWLDEYMPDRTNRICVGGGTVGFVWDEMQPFFARRVRGAAEHCVIKNIVIPYPEHAEAKTMKYNDDRFGDIYSLFMFELANSKALTGSVP